MLQVPTAQLGDSLVLDRMPHALGKLLFGCCVLMFAAELWGGVWEHLVSTSSCLGTSELNSWKQTCTELALLQRVVTRTCRQLCSLEGPHDPGGGSRKARFTMWRKTLLFLRGQQVKRLLLQQ